MPCEGVVEDRHGQLQQVAWSGRPEAFYFFLSVLHFLAEVLACLQTFIEFGWASFVVLFSPCEEHDASFKYEVECAKVFLLEDDLSEVYFDELDVAEYDLKVLVSLLLIDEVEEGYFK